VSWVRYLARRYWFEVGIALLAILGLLDFAVRRHAPSAPHSSVWFVVPAVASLVLAIFARRRFPFAAPAAYWLLAAGISFVDWRLIPFMTSLFVVGMAAAFLLGNLRNARQAGIGLAFVLGGSTIVVYKIPGHEVADLAFIPSSSRSAGLPGLLCASAPRRPRRQNNARPWPSGSGMRRRASRSRRSVRGSRVSSTTSSLTRSA
jgi:hypothetical protein